MEDLSRQESEKRESQSSVAADKSEGTEHLVGEQPLLDTSKETIESANVDGAYGSNQNKKKKKKKKKTADASANVKVAENTSYEENRDESEGHSPSNPQGQSNSSTSMGTAVELIDCKPVSEASPGLPSAENEISQESTKKKKKKKKKKRTEIASTCDEGAHAGNGSDSTSIVVEASSQPNKTSVTEESHQLSGDRKDIEEKNKQSEMTREGANSNFDSNPISHNQTEANSSRPIEGDFPDVAGDNSLPPVEKKKKKKKKKKQESDSQPPISGTSSCTGTVTENEFVADNEILSGTLTSRDGSCSQKIVKEPISCLEKAAELTTAGSGAFPPLMQDENLGTAEATTMKGSDFEVTNDSSRKDKAGSKDLDKQEEKPDYANPMLVKEMRNMLCIFKLIYGVGLRALRSLFMDINPSWSNQPLDAACFDKGTMKLRKEQEVLFNKGDINEWDFSLMTTVLLYSKICSVEISNKPDFAPALRELRKCRNSLLGHPSTERMSESDFNTFWPLLSDNFIKLGADPTEVAEILLQSDEVHYSGEYYKQLFLKEKSKEDYCREKLEVIEKKLDTVIANQPTEAAPGVLSDAVSPKELSGPNWDEWIKFCDVVGNFESHLNQYILVTDALPNEELECFSVLRAVSWKMVLDFDPMSEEKGFYCEFTSKEGQRNLVNMLTPAELRKSTMGSLLRQIDPQKIQWLFINGRQSDAEGSSQSFPDWEATSVKHVTRLFSCCSDPDKFDKQKPIVCLILPFRNVTLPYLNVTLNRLIENFDEFRVRFVSFKHEFSHLIPRKFEVRHLDLSPKLVRLGLSDLLSVSATQEYRLPSSHAGIPAKLSQNEFLYLSEHLEILYQGCESLPEFSDDPAEAEIFFEEHRKSFMSGNQISLISLYDNHDARRELSVDIKNHVQRLLDQGLTRSMIVEIRHSPGTGGSTIARRVLWDLHKTYPCALLKILSSPHYFDEDNTLSDKFADRISALEEICETSPVILIDGQQSGMIGGLSNKLVRMLCNKGKRALLLRCQHGSKTSRREESSNVHFVFDVNVKLEESISDLNEFQSKYKEYISKTLGENQRPNLRRVFHFPLLSMMEEFRPKLEKIIDDTLDEMGGIQQEIALVVAFLQKYANHTTPALLLYDAFKDYIRVSPDEKSATYEDIKCLFTEQLLNLMIPAEPLRRRGKSSGPRNAAPEKYTLQHPLVAELVLRKVLRAQECDLFGMVRKFLQLPIYHQECFLPLFEELFLYNKYGMKLKFSILFEDLKRIDSELAGQVFCQAAVKTNDAAIFANAARFLAKKEPPSFEKAKVVMQQAFQANKSMVRLRSLYHTKGVVLYNEMKHNINTGKVKNLQTLEDQASEVLSAYHKARNFPPTYPHPLIGEVEVWLACVDWIMKNKCNRDSDNTLKFITKLSPSFFRTCVSDSFYLLDVVDEIVQSVPNLTDPEETQRLSNNARLSLMVTFKQGLSATGRRKHTDELIQVCEALCSAPNFPRTSQIELKKLQAYFFLHASDPIDLNFENLQYLLRLLEELVLVENEFRLAHHLMKVCVLVTGPRSYSLQQGLTLSERWQDASPNDCMPYFYQMAIYFLNILDGHSLEFAAKYVKALRMCREKSQNHFRSTQSTLFVGKEGQGMSRLINRNTLFQGETDYATDKSEKVSKFWRIDSRRKLLECKGRIRVEQSSGRPGKIHPYIELVQGNLQLYVGKNANIGKAERDFAPGALVYFVVSFNLHGPVANGITFSSQKPSHV